MRRLSRLVLITVFAASPVMSFPGVAAASAPLIVDQQQPVIDTSVGGLAIGGQSQQIIAQTVTSGIPGLLADVRLPLGCDPDATLTVQIQGVSSSGAPNGLVLTSQTMAGSAVPGGTGFRDFTLDSPVFMPAGQRFAIVLSAASPNPSSGCGVFQGPVGDSYTGGDIYFQSLPNGLGNWVCQCVFTGFRLDLPFQTLVEPAATFAAVASLTQQFVSDAGIANSLTSKLAAAQSAAVRGDLTAKAGLLGAYVNEVEAQAGKALTGPHAQLLIQLVGML